MAIDRVHAVPDDAELMHDSGSLVRGAALAAGVLEPAGELKVLDSLDLVNLVVELERAMGCDIPPDAVTDENFTSLEALTQLVARLTGGRSAP